MTKLKDSLQTQLSLRGMSAYALAKKAGLPNSSVKNILLGKVQNPRYDTLAAIANVLDVDPTSLMAHPGNRKSKQPSKAVQFSDPISIGRFEKASQLLLLHCKKKQIALTKERMFHLLDQLYEYLTFAGNQPDSKDISDTIAAWLLHQEELLK